MYTYYYYIYIFIYTYYYILLLLFIYIIYTFTYVYIHTYIYICHIYIYAYKSGNGLGLSIPFPCFYGQKRVLNTSTVTARRLLLHACKITMTRGGNQVEPRSYLSSGKILATALLPLFLLCGIPDCDNNPLMLESVQN